MADNPAQEETTLAGDLTAAFDAAAEVEEEIVEEVVEESAEEEGNDWTLEVEAPEHWSEKDREEFLNIQQAEDAKDAQLRAYNFLERRYKEMDSGIQKRFQENAQNTRVAEQIKEVFDPYREELSLSGQDELAAVRQMAATHGLLKQDPVNGILRVMAHYGVDPSEAVRSISQAANINPVDIDVRQQSPEVQAIMNKLNETQKQLEEVQRQSSVSQEASLQSQIEAFADAKDSEGNLLHPRFDELSDIMIKEIKAGLAGDVETAYRRAEALTPAEEKKPMVRKSVKQAKKAAAGVKSSTGEHDVTPRTLREELEAQFAKQGG